MYTRNVASFSDFSNQTRENGFVVLDDNDIVLGSYYKFVEGQGNVEVPCYFGMFRFWESEASYTNQDPYIFAMEIRSEVHENIEDVKSELITGFSGYFPL